MENFSTAATKGGGLTPASFGSGDTSGQGRLRRRADSGNARSNASAGEVRAVKSAINRSGLSQNMKRRLLREIDDQANNRGNVNRRTLADIRDIFQDRLEARGLA